ncbi:MAG: S8 family serine peptidase [Bdellovibrionota bacterium]
MKFTSAFVLATLMATPAFAGIMKFNAFKINEARAKYLISSETIIVKVKSPEAFNRRHSDMGEFSPFFVTENGTWGYFKLHMLPDALTAAGIINDLSEDRDIEHAYYAPIPKPATLDDNTASETVEADYVQETPDFESQQNYLQASPVGVGAIAAWEIPGGTGKNVKVIDIETCFEDRHEDFATPFYVGANPRNCESTDHGTAVWGEIAAKRDGKGVTGIAHEAQYGIYGFIEGDLADVDDQYIRSINQAIQGATDNLDAGDVMVIEQQMVGPDLKKYTAVEYWPHIFDQLKAATKKGIHCVQAAGNGNSNFDEAAYEGAFDLSKRDSGCIMVGAVGPTDKERLSFSNYGSRVDVSGYGRGVVTTGYGDLFNQAPERKYTARFSGTSSATPIVSGVVAVASSIAQENRKTITPKNMREMLRKSGVPQGPATLRQRVGNFPAIEQLIKKMKIKVRR